MHINFVEKIGMYILQRKGITSEYIDTICEFDQPMDEIAIVLIARMYHTHLAVMRTNTSGLQGKTMM